MLSTRQNTPFSQFLVTYEWALPDISSSPDFSPCPASPHLQKSQGFIIFLVSIESFFSFSIFHSSHSNLPQGLGTPQARPRGGAGHGSAPSALLLQDWTSAELQGTVTAAEAAAYLRKQVPENLLVLWLVKLFLKYLGSSVS